MADGIPISPLTSYGWTPYSSMQTNNSIMNDMKTLHPRKASKTSTPALKVKTLYFNTDCKPMEGSAISGNLKKKTVIKNVSKAHEMRRSNVTSQECTQGIPIEKGGLSNTSEKCIMPSEVSNRAAIEPNRNTERNSDSFLTRFINVSTDVFTKLVLNTIAAYYNILPTEHQDIRIPRSLPRMQAQLRIYRREMIASQESCCSKCHSDVLFKIIKSIYDCYKNNKKDTKDNLKCVLRDHLSEQHRLDKASKSIEGVKRDKKSNVLTTLSRKARAQKGNVFKGLVNVDIGITISEMELIEKLRKQLNLPEATTAEKKEKRNLGGKLQPIEEKTKKENHNHVYVEQWNDSEIELPSRKKLNDRIKLGSVQLDLQKMREAEAACSQNQLEKIPLRKDKSHLKEFRMPKNKSGIKVIPGFPAGKLAESGADFLTSLDDNTLELKQSILRGLAISGMALPKGRTMSERNLINKIRNEFGLPPLPKTAEVKKKSTKSQTAGLFTSLEEKSNIQKDKLFQHFGEMGLSSTEHRTRMAKALIKKTQGESAHEPPTETFTSVKRSQSKAADFITSLDSKKRKRKEITPGASCLPLSRENTSKKKKKEKKKKRRILSPKSRNVIGAPKDTKTQTTTSFTPLEARMGISMTENNDVAKPVLLTPTACLDDKIIENREKILQELALNKLLLAKGWTQREKQLIGYIRNEICLPLQPTTPTTSTVKRQSTTSLRRKSTERNIQLFPVLKEMSMPIPESTILSERAYINKSQSDVNIVPTIPWFQGDKLANAKVSSFQTGTEQKERILCALALSGMPLSEGRSVSDRKLIAKIKKKLGLPPGPKTDSEKNIYAKALAAGLITPLEGKSTEQKAKILKKIAGLGISLPGGRTVSEKLLIKKLKKLSISGVYW